MDFLFKTWGDSIPNGKPQIYFACHPDDFEKYFERICQDIFQSQDCVIHYKEDMAKTANNQDLGLMLDECQLFVVPVTYKLLSQENWVVLEELPLARSKGIPILPLMMESGLDLLYYQTDCFGEAQYLVPNSNDITSIAYSEKLKRHLDDVLVDKELAARIEKAFRGRIFLSYRKKDRHYANALIRMIHEDPNCKDLSIWYDEFLTPGESYSKNIQEAMKKSDLYLLLVTPSILENPNYVKDVEYPVAKEMGLPILPAEMVRTDMASVFDQFPGVFRCPNPENEEERALLLECIKAVFEDHFLGQEEQEVTERFYLIGRAYFSGIGVETDRQQGRAWIESAAHHGHLEAMEWIYNCYRKEGFYERALHWTEQLVSHFQVESEAEPDLVFWLQEKAKMLQHTGAYNAAIETAEQAWEIVPKELGADHPVILAIQELIGSIYRDLGQNNLARAFFMHVVEIKTEVLGAGHPDAIESIQSLASVLDEEDGDDQIVELYQAIYFEKCKIYGGDHLSTADALANLGAAYNRTSRYERALDCLEQAYELCIKWLDPDHPDIWIILGEVALALAGQGRMEDASKLGKEAYKAYCDIFGPEHPKTTRYNCLLQRMLKED